MGLRLGRKAKTQKWQQNGSLSNLTATVLLPVLDFVRRAGLKIIPTALTKKTFCHTAGGRASFFSRAASRA
jgi:hypothetical protein